MSYVHTILVLNFGMKGRWVTCIPSRNARPLTILLIYLILFNLIQCKSSYTSFCLCVMHWRNNCLSGVFLVHGWALTDSQRPEEGAERGEGDPPSQSGLSQPTHLLTQLQGWWCVRCERELCCSETCCFRTPRAQTGEYTFYLLFPH